MQLIQSHERFTHSSQNPAPNYASGTLESRMQWCGAVHRWCEQANN
jgi:hypothetical protein